jgi:nitrite reductase (NADH) large subunit
MLTFKTSITEMGLKVHCGARTDSIVGADGSTDNDSDAPVSALRFSNEGWEDLDVQMVVVSAGIKPRDELARQAGIAVGERGGVVVDDQLRTSAKDVYAIGEIALYNNFIYGLIAPGYDMAGVASKIVAEHLGYDLALDSTPAFTGADLSTKLKLLGCDVASFGVNQPGPDDTDVSEMVWNDSHNGVYRKLIFNKAGTKLRGGILVGDAADYTKLHKLTTSEQEVENPALLLAPTSARGAAEEEEEEISMDPNSIVCSCNDVSRGTIAAAVAELGVDGATMP